MWIITINCRPINTLLMIHVIYACVFGFEKLDFNYWSNILKKYTYQLVQMKNDFFRRSLLFNTSIRVCVFTFVVRSSVFTMLFSLSIQDFGVSRPFILAMCFITFSASATLLLETSHRKLSGKMLRKKGTVLILLSKVLIHHDF